MTHRLNRQSGLALVILSLAAVLYADQATSGIWAQLKNMEQQYKANLAALDQQIAPLRQQIQTTESSLKPLQAQRESLVAQFEDQRAPLRDQVEPGYMSAYQTEKQALTSAKTQHDQAISAANEQYSSQRQQIMAQFQAAVKGLKKV